LKISEDPWEGDAEFTVKVDGQQVAGDYTSGVNDVQVSFINDAYGGSSSEDRNSTDTFAVGGTTPTETAPADTLTLQLSEDAYQGDAQLVPHPITARHISARLKAGHNLLADSKAAT